jgi:hypothetical protein
MPPQAPEILSTETAATPVCFYLLDREIAGLEIEKTGKEMPT